MDKVKEQLGERGKEKVTKEVREAIKPVVKQLTEKLGKMGYDKKDFGPAIQKGIDEAKSDV